MIGFLRRRQPRNVFLAGLYWIAIVVVTTVVLFVAFFYLDNLLPGDGMF